MPRFKIFLEYQGTRYSGWQIQKNARTIQGELSAAVGKISGGARFELYGSGRTDAGVHAIAQVAHLDLGTALKPAVLQLKLNDELPSDIHILRIEPAHPRFHARHHAISRSYLYQISRRKTAFGKKLVWWIRDELDVRWMKQAAELFVGMKDFQSFSAGDADETSTRVLVDRVDIAEHGALILVRIEGSHFLWNMVRRIVGVLVEVGRGKMPADAVRGFLEQKSAEPARLTAPPSGLFLERVYYQDDPRLTTLEPVLRIGG